MAFQDFPCLCGHAYGTHSLAWGMCRGKRCECKKFLNEEYMFWRLQLIKSEFSEYTKLEAEFLTRKAAEVIHARS